MRKAPQIFLPIFLTLALTVGATSVSVSRTEPRGGSAVPAAAGAVAPLTAAPAATNPRAAFTLRRQAWNRHRAFLQWVATRPSTVVGGIAPRVSGSLYAAWSRVATCESGGWVVLGSAFPDSLGITAHNWFAYGGGSDVTPSAQIAVAERLRSALGIGVPDQSGCAAW